MRKRAINPRIWTSKNFLRLDYVGRLLFIGLITQADDFGYGDADAHALKAQIFPADDIPPESISSALEWMASRGQIDLAKDDQEAIYHLTGWDEEQTLRSDLKRNGKYRERFSLILQRRDSAPVVERKRSRPVTKASRGRNEPVTKASQKEDKDDPENSHKPKGGGGLAKNCNEDVTALERRRYSTGSQVSKEVSNTRDISQSSDCDISLAAGADLKKTKRRPEIDLCAEAIQLKFTRLYGHGARDGKRLYKTCQHLINLCRGKLNPLDVIEIWDPEVKPTPAALVNAILANIDDYADKVSGWGCFEERAWPVGGASRGFGAGGASGIAKGLLGGDHQ